MNKANSPAKKNPLLILGWDGAEWELIDKFCEQGLMPHFKALREIGSSAPIASLQPMLSPLLWTSIITGKRAHDHGILGFVEEGLKGPRAISSLQREVPTLWNILSEANYSCQVVNWWPSNPVEKIKGQMVANTAWHNDPSMSDPSSRYWPPSLAELHAKTAVSSSELTSSVLGAFFPLLEVSEEENPLVQQVATIIARTASQFNLCLELLEEESDLRCFYFEALDQLQHLAVKYHPPRLAGISEEEFRKFHYIITAAYRWHDEMLGAILQKASEHTIIILSDHGFEVSGQRQVKLQDLPAAPATEHRSFGVFLAAGVNIKTKVKPFGLSLLDIFPTVLYYFDLPLPKDIEGKAIQDIFNFKKELSFIPTWNGAAPQQFASLKLESGPSSFLKDLEDLEYVNLKSHNPSAIIREEQEYNKAISLKEVGKYQEALDLADQNITKSFKAYRWYILKGRMVLTLKGYEQWLSFHNTLLPEQQKDPQIQFLNGMAHLQNGDAEAALLLFKPLEALHIASPLLFHEMGQSLFLAGQNRAASQYFSKALELNPNFSAAIGGKAQIAFQDQDWTLFQKYANQALALKMFQPQLHYLWANYYSEQQQIQEAKKALEICLTMAPNHLKALALKAKIEGEVPHTTTFIVSGFPRSGTSLMMALLATTKIELLSDGHRKPDVHNPRGYFESEAIKDFAQGTTDFLKDSAGKALKVVAPILPYLPARGHYKVIWMERPTIEIILSQAKMRGEAASLQNFPFQKAQQLEVEKERFQTWMNQQPHIEWISVEYESFLKPNAKATLQEISLFLNEPLTMRNLEEVVDLQLHRNKIG